MKKFFKILAVVACALALFAAGCAGGDVNNNDVNSDSGGTEQSGTVGDETDNADNTGSTDKTDETGGADPSDKTDNTDKTEADMYIIIGGKKLGIKLADTAAAKELSARVKQGGVTYCADDYGGFEKVGELGFSLPANDERITTEAGDIMLYQGDKIVIFYGSNTWEYTRLGRVNFASAEELRAFLNSGGGEIEITLSAQ